MTPDPSGSQEPEKARFHFPKGQGVRIVEGAFTEYIGTVSESDAEQQKVTVLISFFGKPTRWCWTFSRWRKSTPCCPRQVARLVPPRVTARLHSPFDGTYRAWRMRLSQQCKSRPTIAHPFDELQFVHCSLDCSVTPEARRKPRTQRRNPCGYIGKTLEFDNMAHFCSLEPLLACLWPLFF